MNNFENALKKLDRIEQNLNNQAQEITNKDNRIAQLEKLFQGTAKVFSKQHNYVNKLKEQLQKELEDKNISEEKSQHLQEDIERLEKEWSEMDNRLAELEEERAKSSDVRDLELQELKTKLATVTKQLDDIIDVNQQVYHIMESYSTTNGLLPRTKEIFNNLSRMKQVISIINVANDDKAASNYISQLTEVNN